MSHNVTEGLGIAAPAARDASRSVRSPALPSLLAPQLSWGPGWAGMSPSTYSASSSSGLLPELLYKSSSRSGAVARQAPGGLLPGWSTGGFPGGIAVMYATGLLVA